MKRSDEQIKKDIVDELYWDDRLDASKITVSVDNGFVKLSGEVPSYNNLVAARSAAWRMPGVIDVVDDLKIKYVTPPVLPTDDEIQRRADQIIIWDPDLEDCNITVTVVDGIATLEGTVDAFWKKTYVENRLVGLRGVIFVENKLAVTPTRDVVDEAIAEDVVAAMERDVLVDPEDVTVEVIDGIVTLTGTVPTWSSRRAAEDDAIYTAGVAGVDNRLRVAL